MTQEYDVLAMHPVEEYVVAETRVAIAVAVGCPTCRTEGPCSVRTRFLVDGRTPSMDHAYHRGLTDPEPDAFIMGDDGSPEWTEYWRGVRDRTV